MFLVPFFSTLFLNSLQPVLPYCRKKWKWSHHWSHNYFLLFNFYLNIGVGIYIRHIFCPILKNSQSEEWCPPYSHKPGIQVPHIHPAIFLFAMVVSWSNSLYNIHLQRFHFTFSWNNEEWSTTHHKCFIECANDMFL